jgi:Tfp pilus assembly protein PilF
MVSFSTCVIFYVNGRYRIPVWPLLIPPAAVGIDRLVEWSRTNPTTAHPNRKFVGAAALVGGVALIGLSLAVELSRAQMVIGWHNWGVASARASLDDEAVRAYEEVLAIRAGHVPTLENLSRLYLKRRDAGRAEATLNRLVRHAPDSYWAHKGMADLRFQQMDWAGARRAAERALAIRPGNRQTLLILAGASVRLHDYESACPLLERLDQVETLDGSFHAMLNACRRMQRAATRSES